VYVDGQLHHIRTCTRVDENSNELGSLPWSPKSIINVFLLKEKGTYGGSYCVHFTTDVISSFYRTEKYICLDVDGAKKYIMGCKAQKRTQI
jgi:hypothetical protein